MAESLTSGDTVEQSAAKQEGLEAACLIVALEGGRPRALPSRHWLIDTDYVSLGRSNAGRVYSRSLEQNGLRLRLRLPDEMVSAKHAELRREGSRWTIKDLKSRNGTAVNGAKVKQATLADRDVITIGRTALVYREAALPQLPEELDATATSDVAQEPSDRLQTMSPGLEHRFVELAKIARARASVVILGESGTGKELIARAVHRLSARPGPLVPVNCGGLPEDLIESELFGYRRGAFSGAISDHRGLIAASDLGTLFLDEIGELPLSAQAALLRVLQDGEVRPVGATSSIKVDLRIVCATNRDLAKLVATGKFREDLWSRLNAYTMQLPPLRERKEDLGLLLQDLLPRYLSSQEEPTLSMAAIEALFVYDWPLNIRQLEKVLESAVALATGAAIDDVHLRDVVRAHGEPAEPAEEPDEVLRARLVAFLRTYQGNLAAVGRVMGKHRQQIDRWCQRLNIDPDEFRDKRKEP